MSVPKKMRMRNMLAQHYRSDWPLVRLSQEISRVAQLLGQGRSSLRHGNAHPAATSGWRSESLARNNMKNIHK